MLVSDDFNVHVKADGNYSLFFYQPLGVERSGVGRPNYLSGRRIQ